MVVAFVVRCLVIKMIKVGSILYSDGFIDIVRVSRPCGKTHEERP